VSRVLRFPAYAGAAEIPAFEAYASDDFTSYADTAALRTAVGNGTTYRSDVENPTLVTLDTSVTFEGHNTMRYDFPEDSPATPQVAPIVSPVLDNVWFRVRIKFVSGFNTTGVYNGFTSGVQGTTVSIASGVATFTGDPGLATGAFFQTASADSGSTFPNTTSDVDAWEVTGGSGTTRNVTKVNAVTSDTITSRSWRTVESANKAGYSSSNAYKFLFVGYNSADGRSGIEYTYTDEYVSFVGFTRSGNVIFAELPNQNGTPGLSLPVVNEWTDGEWYEYVTHYDLPAPDQGRYRWWYRKVGDPAYTYMQGDSLTSPAGELWPSVNRVMIGLNYNQKRAVGQSYSLWVGDWTIVDGDSYSDPFDVGA
jgi:hypothetical protein